MPNSKVSKILLVLLTAAIGHAQQSQPAGVQSDALQQEIIAHERAGLDAFKTGDIKAFSDSTAEDAVFIDSGGIATKAEVLEHVAGFRLTDYTMADIKFVALSADSGLIAYRLTETGNSHGHDFTVRVYISSLWAKHSGKWLCEFSQETAVRQPAPPVAPKPTP